MRVQLLGLCRFSYLGGRGFQVEHPSLEARRAFLYDPARLARRWHWFENVTLPAFRAQTDPDFTLVVMTGPDLPEPWMSRLRAVEAEIPQLRLSLVEPMDQHFPACQRAVEPFRDPRADVVGHFRQDDDDAVAVDFIEHARRDFAMVETACARHDGAAIDYMRGLVLRTSPRGMKVTPRMIFGATAALVVYLPPEDRRTAVHLPHWRIGEIVPTLTLGAVPMFCRTISGDNDSGDEGAGHPWVEPPEDPVRLLRERFRLDRWALNHDAKAMLGSDARAATACRPAGPSI